MTDASSRWVGTTVLAMGVVLYGVAVALGARHPGAQAATYLLYVVVGGMVLRHFPRNPVGWFVTVMGMVPLVGNLGEAVLARSPGPGFITDVATWIVGWYFFVFLGAFLPLFHVFPTGRPLPGIWRWWYRMAVYGSAALVIVYLFGPPDEGVNPFEIPLVDVLRPVLGVSMGVGMLAGLVTGVVSLGVRYHRSRGRERAQLRVFFLSVIVSVAAFIASSPTGLVSDVLNQVLTFLAFTLPGVGIAVAVVRHGLFDIDRLVSRTVTYAALTLIVVGIYVFPVLVLPDVLGLSSDLAVASATLAAASVFSALRRRIQDTVDRRFNRARYDAEHVVASFSGWLRSAVDLERVTSELERVVGTALVPSGLSVWFAEPNS